MNRATVIAQKDWNFLCILKREKSVQADKQFTNLTKKPINRLQQTTKHKNEQQDKR